MQGRTCAIDVWDSMQLNTLLRTASVRLGVDTPAQHCFILHGGEQLNPSETVVEAGVKLMTLLFLVESPSTGAVFARDVAPQLMPIPPERLGLAKPAPAPVTRASRVRQASAEQETDEPDDDVAPPAQRATSTPGNDDDEVGRDGPVAGASASSSAAAREPESVSARLDAASDRLNDSRDVAPDALAMTRPRFDPSKCSSRVALSDGLRVAETDKTWSSVAMFAPGLSEGRRSVTVQVVSAESSCGAAVGVAGIPGFGFAKQSLGAQAPSWAYSKTGKLGVGGEGFRNYGDRFATGDDLDIDVEVGAGGATMLRFWRNGELQGGAAVELGSIAAPDSASSIVPAACMGSNTGSRLTRLRLAVAPLRAMDPVRRHSRMVLSEGGAVVENGDKWATALGAHYGVTEGSFSFAVQLDKVDTGGGVAVGFVDADFGYKGANMGAAEGSWAFSKTGKVGAGAGFRPYGTSFASGDVITCSVDMGAGRMRFALNKVDLGVAFSSDDASFADRHLIPAVCLGSSTGSAVCRVRVVPPARYPLFFTPEAAGRDLVVVEDGAEAQTLGKWASVLLDHEGARGDFLTFAVEMLGEDRSSGAALGFADAVTFDPRRGILGATPDSWALSSRGRVGAGSSSWSPYSPSWNAHDVLTADADLTAGTVTFYKGNTCLGVALEGLPTGRRLRPAACIGSSKGGVFSAVRAVPPAVIRWDPSRSKSSLKIESGCTVCRNGSKWATAVADHPGRSAGILTFGLQVITCDAGVAWGFVDARKFHAASDNLGTAKHSWAVSRTGKRAASRSGSRPTWEPFCERIRVSAGDHLGATADLDTGAIIFYYNGIPLGEAYSDVLGSHHVLVPAVCTGSSSGGSTVAVKLVPNHVPE